MLPQDLPKANFQDIKREERLIAGRTDELRRSVLNAFAHDGESVDRLVQRLNEEKRSLEEIGRQNKNHVYPLAEHSEAFCTSLDQLKKIEEEKQTKMVLIYRALRMGFWNRGAFSIAPKSNRSEDVMRIDQIKTLIDLYNVKIKDMREDKRLDEANREDSMEYMKRLRERDVALLEGEA